MDKAHELALKDERGAHGRVVVAERCLYAKGRYGRTWFAGPGGLWFALTLYDDHLPQTRDLLPISVGLALVRTCLRFGADEARLKWINDVHARGRKLGGVLVEKRGEWMVIGVGLNVNNEPPAKIPAQTLKELVGRPLDTREVLSAFLEMFRVYYGALRELEAELAPYAEVEENFVVEEFRRLSDTLGRCVAWATDLEREEPLFGRAREILPNGHLLIETEESEVEVAGGEVIYL